MHGCSLGFALLVNAEVDSMGGVVDGGVGTGVRTSPRRAAIEKAQAELRLEYNVREERRRELEFLEKGGNPLDFKFGSAASVSVQSTSLADQPPEQFAPSEAKGSFALTASPRGDSVESSGRLGALTVNEPNSADNLLLFDGESEFTENKKHPVHPLRSNIAPPSEQSSQLDGSQNAKGSGESTVFGLPKSRAYKRRRPNRGGARSSSTDAFPSQGGHLSSSTARHGHKYAKATLDADRKKDHNVSSNSSLKPTSADDGTGLKVVSAEGRADTVLDNVQAIESSTSVEKVVRPAALIDVNNSLSLQKNQHSQNPGIDVRKTPDLSSQETDLVSGRLSVVSLGTQCPPCVVTSKTDNQTDSSQLNGYPIPEGGRQIRPNEVQYNSAACSTKVLDSESSCTHTTCSLDRSNNGDQPNTLKDSESNGNANEQTLLSSAKPDMEGEETLKDKSENKDDGSGSLADDVLKCVHENHQTKGSVARAEGESHGNVSDSHNEMMCSSSTEGLQVDSVTVLVTERKSGSSLDNNTSPQKENDDIATLRSVTESAPENADPPKEEETCNANQNSVDLSTNETGATLSVRGFIDGTEKRSSDLLLKSTNKAHEDSILEEARIIEAKRKRIAELSIGVLLSENHPKSHWSFVLEEMAWLANDFAQERRWKTTVAAQVCHQVARSCQVRFEQQNLRWKQKIVAKSLVKAVMEFWNAAEKSSQVKVQRPGDDSEESVKGYAMRFLKYNTPLFPVSLAEAPGTPDRISDLGIQEVSWQDHFTEEELFYTVPPGAMETYRRSIESHVARVEISGNSIQEEREISMYDTAADNGYEEEEGETSTYYLSGGFEANRSSKFAQKKRNVRSSEQGSDSPFMHCMDNKFGAQQSSLMGKRPANTLNGGPIPTKRMRTAPRQRFQSPFTAGTSGGIHGPNKTDASSGDTNSFQDDQSTMHGGSQLPNGFEVESVRDSEKQLPFDSTEVSKPKRRKPKHLGSAYEQRWQLDNNFQNEQRDYSRKRLDSHQLESNGSSGLYSQHVMKKPKLMRQSLDNSFDNLTPMPGSVPSPVASQMSNMSHSNKLIKIFSGRDRGRKPKSLKIPVGQTGSGSGWSHFEDQALVVLVHDMGPNWELISDAINSTLQLKFIYRKPKECKERHKILMEISAGDGADSAEDSGSSQPYPTTLPGIPKGSARQLFQRLQGPKEEEAIKSHFEKIIMISQKQHSRRTQNDSQDRKPIQPHNSHATALSQVCAYNHEGHPLTPLDLCDSTSSSPDLLQLGYQASHGSGVGTSNQGSAASMLPASGPNTSIQGSSGLVLSNSFPSPGGPTSASPRDSRYGAPRAASLAVDEPQRMQQYNHVFSGRNIQQSGLSMPGAPSGTDRRMLPGGNGMGIMGGINRSMPIARPGFQGLPPAPMLNSGNMLSSNMVAMSNPASMHPGVGPGQGSAMVRPRDIVRPGQNAEHQRQMMVPELQLQAAQGSSQGVPPYGSLSSAFPSQTSPPSAPAYPLHKQIPSQQSHILTSPHHPPIQSPNHAPSTQQQIYAMQYAKQQQQQQRLLQQQQHHQQFGASNALMPHVPPQAQLPASSSLQNTSQVHPQASPVATQSSSMSPRSQPQQKLHMPPHGLSRNPQTSGGGLTNQMGKQRQRQLQQHSFQQSGRHHPHQRQQSQQQQTKHMKGAGRGNMLMHQNLTMDPSLINGMPTTSVGQSTEKPEHGMHLMQGPGLHPVSGVNSVQPSKPLQAQQKTYPSPPMSSSKPVQLPSHTDTSNQGNTAGQTSLPPSHHHQQQPHHKLVNQPQPSVQRLLKQNHHMNADLPSRLLADQPQDDHQATSNSSPMGTTTAMPQPTVDMTTAASSESFSASQRKVPEHAQSSGMPNPVDQLALSGSLLSANSALDESSMPTGGQGPGTEQSSDGSPSLGHNVGAQWQQQSQLQPPLSSTHPTLQQHEQQSMPQQLSLQSEQQTHVEAGSSNLYQTH